MTATTKLYALAVSGLVTLDMHSLNNEGGEGNQISTRMVNIVAADGQMYNVNAISGDMLKHIHSEHLHRIAVAEGLPLSAGALTFNANRINADAGFITSLEGKTDVQGVDALLETCAVSDMMGILVTAGGRSLPRKSIVEYAWVVGLPDSVETDSYFHVKYASERSKGKLDATKTDEARQANVEQAIFYRPASSGQYAVVVNLELARIGFNDISQTYAVDDRGRSARQRAILESLLYTFVEPAGAMRAAQNPHIVDFHGVVSLSSDVVPAPTLSPLNSGFADDLQRVASALNAVRPGAIALRSFDSMGRFAEAMSEIIRTSEPYKLREAR